MAEPIHEAQAIVDALADILQPRRMPMVPADFGNKDERQRSGVRCGHRKRPQAVSIKAARLVLFDNSQCEAGPMVKVLL